MKNCKDNGSEVKDSVAKSNNLSLSEEAFTSFINHRTLAEVMNAHKNADWNGQPLEEDKVYHLKNMAGLRLYCIRENRHTHRRAVKMQHACHENGQTTPAVIVDAQVVAGWGLKMIDPATREEVEPEPGSYCIMEGHGRLQGWLIDLSIASVVENFEPFDFGFVYKQYESPEAFGQGYVSCNADMTRTTNKDRLNIAAGRSKDPRVTEYFRKIREDGCVSKASFFWTLGRELTSAEVTQFVYGKEEAPVFDPKLTDALLTVYGAFKEAFSNIGAEKICRGVAAAQWSADQLKTAADKKATAAVIAEKLSSIDTATYTAILTAKTCSKKGQTREAVIKQQLTKMMKQK